MASQQMGKGQSSRSSASAHQARFINRVVASHACKDCFAQAAKRFPHNNLAFGLKCSMRTIEVIPYISAEMP